MLHYHHLLDQFSHEGTSSIDQWPSIDSSSQLDDESADAEDGNSTPAEMYEEVEQETAIREEKKGQEVDLDEYVVVYKESVTPTDHLPTTQGLEEPNKSLLTPDLRAILSPPSNPKMDWKWFNDELMNAYVELVEKRAISHSGGKAKQFFFNTYSYDTWK